MVKGYVIANVDVTDPEKYADYRPLSTKAMEAFGGKGYHVTTTKELQQALDEAIALGKPVLINAVIDESAGTESGRLTNLNPQSAASKK